MIRHHNRNPKIELGCVVMQAAFQDDRPRRFGKNPPMVGAEGNKVLPIIDLKMRKLPTVKSLRHKRWRCGDSRPRLSGGAKLRYAW